jgi:hypothetical protein
VYEKVHGFFPDPFDGGLDEYKAFHDRILQKPTPQNVKENTDQND